MPLESAQLLDMEKEDTKKFKIVSLGCRTNQYEAQAFQDQLLEMGFSPAEEGQSAELCIINTCTVTAHADKDSRHAIRHLARQNPNSRVVVTGCGVESQREAIAAIPEVSDIIPNARKEELVQLLFPEKEAPEFSIKNFEAHTRAFVKVQDGCNSYCTYCVIPYVRGRSRSRPMGEILNEVHSLVGNGYKEIVITGINVGDFDGNADTRLSDLVRAVDKISGVERVRISSIDPDEVDDDLLDAVLSGQHTCPSMHIVLQSGSNVILKRMNRKYTRQIFLDTVERLYAACPDFTVTTDAIVGFPGETEADFQDTLDVVDQVRFAKIHMFPFSPRPRTRAALMPNPVAMEVVRERKQRLMHQSERAAFLLRQNYIGRTMKVLTESHECGHTENFLNVNFSQPELTSNQLIQVELTENTPQGLLGKVI